LYLLAKDYKLALSLLIKIFNKLAMVEKGSRSVIHSLIYSFIHPPHTLFSYELSLLFWKTIAAYWSKWFVLVLPRLLPNYARFRSC